MNRQLSCADEITNFPFSWRLISLSQLSCHAILNSSVAQDWIKVSEIMRDENVLIAEVDCTAEDSEETCDENDVEGFPSLKYGEGGSVLDEYFEDRSFREMYQFAKQNLKRMCSPKSLDLCDDEQKVILDKYMAMSQEEVKIALEAIDDDLEKYEDALEDEIEKLEEDYEKLENSAREKKKNAMDAADYAFAKQILAMKAEGGLGDEL